MSAEYFNAQQLFDSLPEQKRNEINSVLLNEKSKRERARREKSNVLLRYDGFSDIEFNPKKSINCQAAAAALYKALVREKQLDSALTSPAKFIKIHNRYKAEPLQTRLL